MQAKRRNTFATADDAYFAREMMTPTGPGTFADFLHIRVMDAWVHEQDIRRAIGKPGNQGGAAARHSLSRFVRSLPMVVGKRAKAPDGSTVTLRITGAVQADFHVATEAGRAKLVEVAPQPLCVISIDSEAYFAMCCGRQFWKPGDPRVAVSGDTELAGRVLSNFNVMI
ncbi:MAG: maleylpyruvate isomerase family mycothiol-dependent enzyme [Actinobacteria bacterium]|nr:maleylpyruvate isomerase family mycothiol-dependent enzyme [Actinomycetota bacterium]